MNEATKAVFSFRDYKVTSAFFNDVAGEKDVNLSIGFAPSGIFYEKDKIFSLILKFRAYIIADNEELNVVTVDTESTFIFDNLENYEQIPSYFFRNSLGIVFPYLRAFVSTITFQGNFSDPIILPILNLTQLEEPFKTNVEIIKS